MRPILARVKDEADRVAAPRDLRRMNWLCSDTGNIDISVERVGDYLALCLARKGGDEGDELQSRFFA